MMGFEVLAGALESFRLLGRYVVLGGELEGVSLPHRLAAIKTATRLPGKSDGTGFYQGFALFCHETLRNK